MTAPILVGIDPLRHDADAPVLAALLARATGAPVLAVAVYPHEAPVRVGGDPLELRGRALARLSAVAPAFHGVPLETAAVEGPSAARVLHELADARDAALLVVGPTHRSASGHIVLGSTADRLLHGTTCPVAVAPSGFAERMRGIDRIGAAFLETEEGYEALRGAAALAGICGAELHAVTAVEPVTLSATGLVPPYDAAAHVEVLRERAERTLRQALDGLPTNVRAEGEVVVDSTATVLEQFSNDVDLLVCGSRGYGPLGRVWLGGVSRRLVHVAACPVIAVPRGTERKLEALVATACPVEIGHA